MKYETFDVVEVLYDRPINLERKINYLDAPKKNVGRKDLDFQI